MLGMIALGRDHYCDVVEQVKKSIIDRTASMNGKTRALTTTGRSSPGVSKTIRSASLYMQRGRDFDAVHVVAASHPLFECGGPRYTNPYYPPSARLSTNTSSREVVIDHKVSRLLKIEQKAAHRTFASLYRPPPLGRIPPTLIHSDT